MRECKDHGAEYWSRRAESYSDCQTTNDFEYGRGVVEALHELINLDSIVLDIGAGPGSLVIPFAKNVKKVIAIEPAISMIKCLKRNAERK